MRARRILDTKHVSVSFLPTHVALGISLHTVTVPTPVRDRSGKRIPSRRIRFLHLHVPFLFLTLSWTISV